MTAQSTPPLPSLTAPPASALAVQRGTAVAMFAYDVAMGIDVGRVQAVMGTPDAIPRLRPTQRDFQYRPTPVRIVETIQEFAVGPFSTTDEVECVLYDFGAVSISYRVPIEGPLEELAPLAVGLYENAALLADSRARVQQLMERLSGALDRPHLADLVEDYVIYQVPGLAPGTALAHVTRRAEGARLAQLLRAEADPLSADEVENALSAHLSYGQEDLVVVDWNAALIVGAESEDLVAVLEHANLQLLELRHLDDRLNDLLSQAYVALTSRRSWLPFRSRSELRRLARLQVDNAMLFEAVHNALKLVGDQYLARVHRLAARRFHLGEWESSIRRKLETLEAIYAKTYQRAATVRLEVLEWLIVALIAVSIVLPFVPGLLPAKAP